MATAQLSAVDQIGEAAGHLWHLINQQGPLALSKLVKVAETPREVTLQAIGWLAREGKIQIDESRNKIVSLR